jgi:hypothetical protein
MTPQVDHSPLHRPAPTPATAKAARRRGPQDVARVRASTVLHARLAQPEETLVIDARGSLRPAQQVENKLVTLLKAMLLPVSQVRLTAVGNGRHHC